MAVHELVCSCDSQALDGSGDVVAADQQAQIQKLRCRKDTNEFRGSTQSRVWSLRDGGFNLILTTSMGTETASYHGE